MRDRFLKAVPRTQKELEQRSLSFRLRLTMSSERSRQTIAADYPPAALDKLRRQGKDPTEPRVWQVEYAVRGNLLLQAGTDHRGFEFIRAKNDVYSFGIQRSEGLDRYTLVFLEKIGENLRSDERIEAVETNIRGTTALSLCSMFGKPISEWLDSPNFRITGASAIDLGGKELIRIDYEHLVDEVRVGRPCLADGYMICDPGTQWLLREYCATFVNPTSGAGVIRKRVIFEYGEMIKGMPIPKTINQTSTWISDPTSADRTVTVFEIVSKDVPEEVFYLSHYGLPEPTFRRSWFGLWIWYLIAGIVCLVVSAIVFKRRRAAG